MIITELLAVLSISAATGLRLALPLLMIGLLSGESLWSRVPLLAHIPQALIVLILVSGSLLELTLTKDRINWRFLQSAELFMSPFIGTIAGIAIARSTDIDQSWLIALVGVTAGLLALLFQFVQVGWLYRLSPTPLWLIFLEDILCICLVLFAFDAPAQGGLIALVLFWLAIRTSSAWRQWYLHQSDKRQGNPRQGKRNPD